MLYKTVEKLKSAMLSAWLDKLNDEKRVELIRKALCMANGIEAGYISFDIRDGKIKVWSEQPTTFQPGFEEYQIILLEVEPNWRANWSWEYYNILDIPEKEEVEDFDQIAQSKGWDSFDDALCDFFADDIYQNDAIYKKIKEFTDYELQPYLLNE